MARKLKTSVGYDGHFKDLEVTIPENEPPPWDARSSLTLVSQRVPRVDAALKVTGRAKYTYDVHLPGMLYGKILRSPHPAARITKLDLAKAKALPGVKAVWSEKVGKKLSFQGQEVAAVAATSLDIAEDALKLVQVEYEKRPFVVDLEKARKPGAPPVFEPSGGEKIPAPRRLPPGAEVGQSGNVRSIVSARPPGVDIGKAFAEAEVTVEGSYRTQVQTHSALETHGAVAKWDGGHLTIWISTQATFGVRDQVAEALKLGKDKVRVLCDFMGGGFGAKFNAGPYTIIAARMARDAHAPVKIMLSRHEEHLCTGNRPDSVQWIKLGAKKDGTLVALHLKSYGTPGVGTGAGTGGPARAIYKVKAAKIEEADVFTNAGAAEPFRAPGHPQGCFALEQAMDELAEKLGMDPLALRRKNLQNPVQVAEVERGAAVCQAWRGRGRPGSSPGPVKRGVGVACGVWYKIVNPATQVQIDIHNDGRVEVKNGAQDIGTGTRTYMAQIAAEELGIPLDLVTVRLGDTTLPIGPGSGGSCTTPSIAPAVRAAAYLARQKMFGVAAKLLKVAPDELEASGGRIHAISDMARSVTWKQMAARIPGDKVSVIASRAGEYEAYQEQIGGVQFAEVEVDTETGQVRVRKVTAIHDCGRPLNRLTAESQIAGGVIQGVSYALFENRQLDRTTGRMCNPNLEWYKICGANDCPAIEGVLVDVSNAGNNAGVTGLGEPTTVPTAAAIANAIYNATGARMRELPITPDRVLAALRKGGAR